MAAHSGCLELSERYEAWRAKRIQVIDADLQAKYTRMAESPWLLARGAYPRFWDRFSELLPELAATPVSVAVGDLHPETFGTWRDRTGRLIWGVQGLEEADLLPYAADLVRLASTTWLAIDAGLLDIDPEIAVAAILTGWSARIAERHPIPSVLGPHHVELYELHREQLRDPVSFGREIDALAPFERALPKAATRLLASISPTEDFRPRLKRAEAGLATLGARRIIAVGEVSGGPLVREVLQVPGPISMWHTPKRRQVAGLATAIDAGRGLAADPWRRQSRKWVVRGLDGAVVTVQLPQPIFDVAGVLTKMGAEAANIHLTPVAEADPRKAIRHDAAARPSDWLTTAAAAIVRATTEDHADFSVALVAQPGR